MIIHHPSTALEAVLLRKSLADSMYLLGGTDVLRLGGGRGEDTELIDLNGLVPSEIKVMDDGSLFVGAAATFNDIISSAIVPSWLKDAAKLCPSDARRNAATIGGNVGARRDDSFLIAALAATGTTFHSITPHGNEMKKVSDYALTKCRRIIDYFVIDPKATCSVRRFGLTSTSHAVLIAASGSAGYALSVKGSPLSYGEDKDIWKTIVYTDGLEGRAEYKKYLASIVFEERR